MKQALKRCLLALLVIMLALPILPANVISAAAKKPTLSPAKITLVGEGATNNLKLQNVDKSKVKKITWYSQNEKVAVAEATSGDKYTGKVTAIGKGKTNVRVKITYKDGKVVRPNCSVTVQIPAKEVKISNAVLDAVNNNHVIVVGESFDFNRKLTPSNANDKTYWFLEDLKGKDIATVNTAGVVKALKPGFVRLTAKASLTKAGAATSKVTDSIVIEIVEKSAQVVKVELLNTTTLKITFNNAIKSETVLKDKKLLDTVKIFTKTDSKGQTAKALGDLTGSLSTDGKELTIYTTFGFNGLYGLSLTNQIKSTDGLSLVNYNEDIALYDDRAPFYDRFTTDETGLKVTIHFSEPINIAEMKVEDARLYEVNKPALLPLTITILKEKNNYKLSEDRKALTIDLTSVSPFDHDKMFEVRVSGIKDDAGKYTEPYIHPLYFKADTSPKPQARLLTVERTGTNELTATFDKAIKDPGQLLLSNGELLAGRVDTENNKKVKYTLTPSGALLTGMQRVSVGYWNSYNVLPGDTTANRMWEMMVNFTVEISVPTIVKQEFTLVQETGDYQLTLTYNKNVTVVNPTGILETRLVTINNDIYNNRQLTYIATVKENEVTLILRKDQVVDSGFYTVKLPAGFVRDNYLNQSVINEVSFKKDAAVSSELPAPTSVVQDANNPNIVYVTFANKVDDLTASNIANYRILGTSIVSVRLEANNADGATIALTLASNSILIDTIYPIYIENIAGYHNTYSAMKPYEGRIPLKENKAPAIREIKFTYPNTITLTFDETIVGNASFRVIQDNNNLAYSSSINGQVVTIVLTTTPKINVTMRIEANPENNIRDINGNTSFIAPQTVVPTY